GGRLGPPRLPAHPVSLAGLVAVLLVMAGGHVAVAYYDLQAYDLVNCVFDNGQATCDAVDNPGGPGTTTSPGRTPGSSVQPSESLGTPVPGATPVQTATLPPWNGTDRLNILLVGADQRPSEGTFNTDTLIVVSIDPVTKQVALFTLPRDTVDVPIAPGPARSLFGAVYRGKINSLWTAARGHPEIFGGNERTRGYAALKDTLGYLYGLDIRWYVEVNFEGFKQVVDALGGVTVNVQTPVVDDRYPGDSGRLIRVYIPAGIQHMTGSEALIYARSRHASNDFDRGLRQQRVLISLRQQADFGRLIPRVGDLVQALKQAVHTDVPVDQLPQLLNLAQSIDTSRLRSYVFAPNTYATEIQNDGPRGYVVEPHVDQIRAAVAQAFVIDPELEASREKLAAEGAEVWILNGSGQQGQASRLAVYLEYLGLNATAPNQRPDTRGLADTRIRVYNGAADRLPETLKVLKATFGVEPVAATDPSVRVDVIVTTSARTPTLTPPPGQ
ncbi:MAG TPA: LCP family protein, partial [Candidatus Limnocylindrales bacterium]